MIRWKQNFQSWAVSRGKTKCCQPIENKNGTEKNRGKSISSEGNISRSERAKGAWAVDKRKIRSRQNKSHKK